MDYLDGKSKKAYQMDFFKNRIVNLYKLIEKLEQDDDVQKVFHNMG